ncbi:MAG: hypothetical protein ABI947_13010, partial [Chloroflexota bacterium]
SGIFLPCKPFPSYCRVTRIKQEISKYIKFDPKLLLPTINRRLSALHKKPMRRIRFHASEKLYCLPYETRNQIQERNFKEAALYETFKSDLSEKLKSRLKMSDVVVKDYVTLIEATIARLFYQQGLEFSNFVLSGENQKAFEKDLPDIINYVVDDSHVVVKNREAVKNALLMTIRDVVYNGTIEQKLFLEKLSNTYMMLFLLQCDPKLATYFNAMASKLNIYVCTSIIIPALSEFYLDEINRRHWNLLKGAYNAGVTLIINDTILNELVAHLRRITNIYENHYKRDENIYLSDEAQALYVDEIMLRAYFYARTADRVANFEDFIDNFVDPSFISARESIIDWLKTEFGIIYRSDKSIDITINQEEERLLINKLSGHKTYYETALSDAKLILTIYALREKNNETDNSGIFGYRTWWLSKDTQTQKAVNEVFKDKYRISCYIRPDFLYNYIALAPSKNEIDEAYRTLFPSMIGVNISFHLPREIVTFVQKKIAEHGEKNPARLRGILRELSDKLKSDPTKRTRRFVKHYLDEQLQEFTRKK